MKRDTRLVIALLAVIAVIAYAAPLFGGATFVGRDHLTHTIPAKQFLVDTLRDGRLPHWWPGVDLGVPFLANPNHSALYPPAWLTALLPMPWAVDLLLVLHVFFGGLGMAALARRLGAGRSGMIVAATAFMLSGFATSTVVHGGPALTLAWIPWMAWSADRVAARERGVVMPGLVLAAFIAGALLAGDPSFALGGALLALGIGLVRSSRRAVVVGMIALAHVVAVLLASIVVVPALFLLGDSARGGGLVGDAAVAWSMHPLRLFELAWPNALGDPNQTSEYLARAVADSSASLALSPSWALSVYVSIPVLVLAAIGVVRAEKRTRLLVWLALAFLVLALGRYTPIYAAFRTVFVPEQIVRYPEKHIVGALVVVSVFAGLGWQALDENLSRRSLVVGATALAALVLVVVLGIAVLPSFVRGHDVANLAPALDVESGLAESRHQALVVLATVAAIGALLYLGRRRRWLAHAALAVLVGHLASRTWSLLPTFDREHLTRRPQILATAKPGRIARPNEHRTRPADSLAAQARTLYEGAVPNSAARFGFTYLLGYDQGHSARFAKARASLAAPNDATSDRYGVELLIVAADESAGRPILGTDAPYGPYVLVANTGQRPRAFVTADTGITPCTVTSPIPEHVDVTCDAASDGLAVLLDGWAPGWSATVDGAPARIEVADDLVRAVRVTAGRRTIAFRYTTPGFRIGVVVSTIAWMLWLVGVLIARRAVRRS